MNQSLNSTKQVSRKHQAEDREAYDRIVTSGITVIASDDFHDKMVEALSTDEPLPDRIANGVARLISLLHVSAKGTMPIGATIAASYTLMIKAMDFAERALGEEITDDIIAETALKTISIVAPLLGITKEKLQAAMQGGSRSSNQTYSLKCQRSQLSRWD